MTISDDLLTFSILSVSPDSDRQTIHDSCNMSSAIRAVPIGLWIAFCDALNPERRKKPSCQENKLLGEHVLDSLSGQVAEVMAFDSGLGQYLIEFLGEEDAAEYGLSFPSRYEPGHRAWRWERELCRITAT